MTSGLGRNPRDNGSPGKEQEEGSDHVSHAAAVATISMDPTAAEATDDGTGEDQRHNTGGVDGPSSSSDNNRTVAEPQQSGQKGSIHAADRVRGGDAGVSPLKDQEGDNSRNASGELGSSSGSNSLDDGNCSNTAEGGKEQQDGNSKQPESQPPLQGQKSQQAPGPSPKSLGCGSENRQKGAKGGANQKDEEEKEVQGKEEPGGGDQEQGGRPVLKKPDKVEPCPRCDSYDTKFCYYNNYNIKQPRHFCKNCQRYWTAGGTLRNVPVGAGRRKNKHKPIQRLGPGSGSDSELVIPSSSGGEDYLMRSGSLRSSNPSVGAATFKPPSSQGFQGRFLTSSNAPLYDSGTNDKSGVTNKRDGTSADEMQSGDQFRGPHYGGAAEPGPETDPRRAKRVKRNPLPETGVPVGRFGRGFRENSECVSSQADNRDGGAFVADMLMSPESAKNAQWPARGGEAFGGAVTGWNQGAAVPATPNGGGWAPGNTAPWGGMWPNQPWPYSMPMGNWNGAGGPQVMTTPGGNYGASPQGANWGMVDNSTFGGGANWGASPVNAANAAAAWANANVWAGLAAAGNAWGPPWAAWSVFGAGPAAAAAGMAPSPQPAPGGVMGKHRQEGGGEGETRADGVWVPKIVRTEPVRGSAPLQWQQQLGGGADAGYLGLMKNGEMADSPGGQGQEDGVSPPLNLL